MLKSLSVSRRAACAVIVGLSSLVCAMSASAQQQKIRIAFGDVLSTETLSMVIALERAKEKGVDYSITIPVQGGTGHPGGDQRAGRSWRGHALRV